MKKSELRQMIREELHFINEAPFMGKGKVLKTIKVKDLDSGDADYIYRGDTVNIYRSEGSYYVVESPLTGNAIKIPKKYVTVFSVHL